MIMSVPRGQIILALTVVAIASTVVYRRQAQGSNVVKSVAICAGVLALLLLLSNPAEMRIRGPNQAFDMRYDF